jgi:hypothetical protein
MKTISEHNNLIKKGKSCKSIKSTNGRTYFLNRIDSGDWLFSVESVIIVRSKGDAWDTHTNKRNKTYEDINKYFNAVDRILKNKI